MQVRCLKTMSLAARTRMANVTCADIRAGLKEQLDNVLHTSPERLLMPDIPLFKWAGCGLKLHFIDEAAAQSSRAVQLPRKIDPKGYQRTVFKLLHDISSVGGLQPTLAFKFQRWFDQDTANTLAQSAASNFQRVKRQGTPLYCYRNITDMVLRLVHMYQIRQSRPTLPLWLQAGAGHHAPLLHVS